ncbi:MAG: phage tail sheath family protein [Deltaproteobacteria bacterium]|nr:phage tail sheath family protein [Deltaproteobacteria bacterium]MCP5007179.1 phage tail sheath family protein [Planctomycetota bacterium]
MAIGGAPGVYVKEFESGARPIEGVSTSVAGFVGLTEIENEDAINNPVEINSWADFKKIFGSYNEEKAPYLPPSVYGFFANGGKRCYVVRSESDDAGGYIGTDGGPGKKKGLYVFKEIDEISIVCIPGITDPTVQKKMIEHCEELKDRFCILDCNIDADNGQVKVQREGLVSDKGFGALYYPWIQVIVEKITKEGEEEKVELDNIFMPPSGYMAGIYARSDTERGVHKAPANEKVKGVIKLKIPISTEDQDGLNPEGINCIRKFQGRGIRVWGARTLAPKGSLWKYINVRRLFLYLEESIDENTQWVVFEPNNYKLWGRVTATITNFLTTVWRDGALMGKTPEQAFYVKCDRTTMTQDDIDNGKLICEIGVAPVKPAEFVIFRITQWTGGLDTE